MHRHFNSQLPCKANGTPVDSSLDILISLKVPQSTRSEDPYFFPVLFFLLYVYEMFERPTLGPASRSKRYLSYMRFAVHNFCQKRVFIMHQSIPSTITPGLTPGNFFKVVKFPAPGTEKFCEITAPGQKIDKNPAPGDNLICGPSRQFYHDRETIRVFLVLFVSLAFFEFFQRL